MKASQNAQQKSKVTQLAKEKARTYHLSEPSCVALFVEELHGPMPQGNGFLPQGFKDVKRFRGFVELLFHVFDLRLLSE